MRIPESSLFIRDLGRDFHPDALNRPDDTGGLTTMAVGEEGGGDVTTMAVGEEGGDVTTMAVGEETGGDVTSMALGEEGGCEVATPACGDEGCATGAPGGGPTPLEQLLGLFIQDFGR